MSASGHSWYRIMHFVIDIHISACWQTTINYCCNLLSFTVHVFSCLYWQPCIVSMFLFPIRLNVWNSPRIISFLIMFFISIYLHYHYHALHFCNCLSFNSSCKPLVLYLDSSFLDFCCNLHFEVYSFRTANVL